MNTKTKNIITTVLLAIFLLTLSLFCVVKPQSEYSDSERRTLAKFPELTFETLTSGKFMSEFETYTLDQFPLRDTFRQIKAYTNNYVLQKGDNNKIYIIDGYISKMEYPLNDDKISYAADRFKYIYDKILSDTDCNAYLTVVPDKNYFFADKGKLSIDYKEMTDSLKNQTEFLEYIDIFDTLTLENYYKTDTHWRQETLLETAKKIALAMGTPLNDEYTEKTLDRDFYGVYHSQAALPLPPDNIKYLTNDIIENAVVFDYENNKELSVYDMEKAYGKDPYEMFLSGSISMITIENDKAETDKELVIFRDSFGSSIAPLFIEGYKKITVVDIRYLHPNVAGMFIDFTNQDVLFLYSTLVLNNSETIK